MTDRRPTHDRFAEIPAQDDDPVVWDPQARQFVTAPSAEKKAPPAPAEDGPQHFVGPEAVGKAPPPAGSKRPGRLVAEPVAPPPRRAPAHAPPRRPRRWPRVLRRTLLLTVILLPIVVLIGGWVWANYKFSRIARVDVGGVLTPGAGRGTNYLIAGSDSRKGTPDEGVVSGERADTLMLLRIERDRGMMLSIPRDLYVRLPASGRKDRINSAYRDGPAHLVQTVQENLGIPVNRYIELDFLTFAGMVDALGGVTIEFPHPASDEMSGLNVTQSGPVELDGAQALAYVRSRQYTETIDGRRRTDPTGDLGRATRQQQFLRAVMAEAGASRNPFELMRMGDAVSEGLRIDNKMSLIDAVRFAWRMKNLDPQPTVLPTYPFRAGGAAVLGLEDDEAKVVLDQFR